MNSDSRNYQVDRSWILCPSKSFPGKFYYFNVLNGEAAWSLSEIEKRTATKNFVHRVTDKCHGYPEPDTPPSEENLNMHHGHNWFRRPDYFHHTSSTPAFGQPAFPKYGMPQPPHVETYPTMSNWWSQMPFSQPICTPPDLKRSSFDMPHWEPDRNTFRPNDPIRKDPKYFMGIDSQRMHENPFAGNKYCDASTPFKRWSYEPQGHPFAPKPQVNARLFEQKPKPIYDSNQNYWNMMQRRQSFEDSSIPKISQQNFDDYRPKTVIQEPMFRRQRTLSESPVFETHNNVTRSVSMSNLNSANNNFNTPQKSGQEKQKLYFSNFPENQLAIHNSFKALQPFSRSYNDINETRPFSSSNNDINVPKTKFQPPFQFNKTNNVNAEINNEKLFIPTPKENPFKSPYKKLIVKVTSDKRIAVADEKSENNFEKQFISNDDIFRTSKVPEQKINKVKSYEDSDAFQQFFKSRKRIFDEEVSNKGIDSIKKPRSTEVDEKNDKEILFTADVSNDIPSNVNPKKGTEILSNSLLTKDDLRYKLLNRKKCKANETAENTVKVTNSAEKNNKKKVTFDLGVEDFSDVSNEQECQDVDMSNQKEILTISMLRNLASEEAKSDKWFVAIDASVLLEEFEFMEDYVQSDTTCTLLIPLAVQMCVEYLSQGEGGGRQQVSRARSIARALASPPEYVLLQLTEVDTSPDTTVEDSVVNCCLQYMKDGYHVVLITNSEELHEKAIAKYVYCFGVEDIKSAASQKSEVTFDIRKPQISTKIEENNFKTNEVPKSSLFSNVFKDSSNNNSYAINDKIPINVARKGLLDQKNYENINNHSLFSKNNDVNNTEQHLILQKNSSNSKMLADGEDFHGNFFLAPKNLIGPYREVTENDSESTFELNQQLKRFTISDPTKENYQKDSTQQINNENTLSKEAKAKKFKAKLERIKNINSYTLDEYLKKFLVKNKPSEDIIKIRIEEFICSFTQILEETLSDLLQTNSTPIIKSPPWELTEAVEGIKELYEDISSVKIVAEKLSLMLHACRYKDGKLKPSTSEFMRILGCGIILIQCLKANIPTATQYLSEAESSLRTLLVHAASPPEPPSPAPRAPLDTSDSEIEDEHRTNFIKKPSEIVRYLQKHFPQWREQQENQNENQNRKIIRTSGKSINFLKIKNNKSILMHNPETENGGEINNNVLKDNNQNCNVTSNVNPKVGKDIETKEVVKETGAKLLKTLALNTGLKKSKPKDVDVEKMEQINKEMTSMIDDIISGRVPQVPKVPQIWNVNNNKGNYYNKTIIGQTNVNLNGHVDDNVKQKNKYGMEFERKYLTRKIKDTDLRQDMTYVNNNNKYGSNKNEEKDTKVKKKLDFNKLTSPRKENSHLDKAIRDFNAKKDLFNSEKKVENKPNLEIKPKAVKPIKDMEEFLKKMKKNFISFDALEYSENTDDESHKLVINEDYNNNFSSVSDDIEAQRHHRSNNAMAADTTNDSGIEVDSSQAYSLAKSFLMEFTGSFKVVYKFIDLVIQEYSEKSVSEGKRRQLHEKASKTYEQVVKIIGNLKSIIEREAKQNKLMQFLSKTDEEAMSDVRITKYSRVVTKCLEQAKLLSNALKVLLNFTDDNCDVSFESYDSNMQYYNIFE